MNRKVTILLSGMIAGDPWQGGATWAVLQYLLGLQQLGHEVYFVEPISPKSLRPGGSDLADSENARYFSEVTREFGLESTSALLLAGTKQTVGLSYQGLQKAAQRAALLLNISGLLTDENLFSPAPIRVYLDLDPAFNQLWSAVQGLNMRFEGHTHFVTIGQSIGESDCSIPTCGLTWLKTFQPIVLNQWPATNHAKSFALTTVGNWRGYGSIDYQDVFYGQKAHSLRHFLVLPTLTDESFRLALAIHPTEIADLTALATHRWEIVDPGEVAATPSSYRHFIQNSKAEFGVAKSGYVRSRCGWFSDRSICYLASGRPVLAQETGFSRYLPTGAGLFPFETVDDILDALEHVNGDYSWHCRIARRLAEEHFQSDKVLGRLLEQVGI